MFESFQSYSPGPGVTYGLAVYGLPPIVTCIPLFDMPFKLLSSYDPGPGLKSLYVIPF